ncbi:helix-turn-helix domain-containing protein [Bacillus daqingensis]|uniref:Helix-turn-helix domain-containing protein n=1 Tax=Bacillus daqingensis TaxID=872396 RepID=A0ABV9NRW3_9BACI
MTVWRQLKSQRKKLQMKQADVCHGLCSVSYYSKIENGRVIPEENLAAALGERLQLTEGTSTKYSNSNLAEWLLLHTTLLSEEEPSTTPSASQADGREETALLFVLKLRELLKKPYAADAAWKLYNQAECEHPSDSRVRFLLHKARGVLYYAEGWPEHASRSLLQAYCAAAETQPAVDEMIDLHLYAALTMLESENEESAYFHAAACVRLAAETGDVKSCTKAMEAGAEALLYAGLKEEAERDLLLLQQNITGESGERTSLMRGKYYRQRGQSAEAASMLQKSYRSRDGMDRLEVIYELVHVFMEMGMYEDARTWTAHAQTTIAEFESNHPLSSRDTGWKHLFTFLSSCCSQSIDETKEIVLQILPYFETRVQWRHCRYFYNWLAEHALSKQDVKGGLYWRTKAGNRLLPSS